MLHTAFDVQMRGALAAALVLAILALSLPAAGGLYLNEMMSSNSSSIADEDGDYSDWIEIYNSGPDPLNLQGYGLTDNPNSPYKWTFPSKTIAPGEFLLVFCSDKNRLTGPYLHTNYKISASGETMALTDAGGLRVDTIPPVSLAQNESYGRKPDASAQFVHFLEPTPGASNTTQGYSTLLRAITILPAPGFYTADVPVTAASPDTGVTIRYTTDGSTPTESSPVLTPPLIVQNRAGQSPVIALIGNTPPEAPSWEMWRAPVGDVFMGTVVRARAFREDAAPSPVATRTYFVDPLMPSRYTLPVISLATDAGNLFDYNTGIYVPGVHYDPADYYGTGNFQMSGSAWERPVHVEFFEAGGQLKFSQNAGARIHGGGSSVYPQKSIRLYADGYSDSGEFVYKIFPDLWVTAFTRIILRNSGNDWLATLFRDGLIQGLMQGTEVDRQAYRPSIVFINGEFWGIHNIRERYDKYYIESHHGEDDVDLIESNGEVDEGDKVAWQALQYHLWTHDLRDDQAYDYVEDRVDLGNFIDYNLVEIYCRNTDWPAVNSRYWRPRTADGKWRWMLYDTDSGFGLRGGDTAYDHDTLAFAATMARPEHYYPNGEGFTRLLRKLLRNTTFRARFINRMADFLNSRFDPDAVVAQIDAKQAAILPHMQEHLNRWGRTDTLENWLTRVETLRTFARERPAYVRGHFVRFFGLGGTSEISIATAGAGSGTVRVNSLNLAAGQMPWKGIYFQDVPIELQAVPAPGSRFAGWEGINAEGATAQITLSGDLSVTARFEVAP